MNQSALGKRIREERKKSNLTQEQLAELINVSTTYVGFIERGERSITLDKLVSIATALGISVDYLLRDSVTVNSSTQEKLLLKLFSSANSQQKDFILEMTKLILNHS